jgi:hypothetical protein
VIAIEKYACNFHVFQAQDNTRRVVRRGAHCAPPRKLASPTSWATHSRAFDRSECRKASALLPTVAGVGRLVV